MSYHEFWECDPWLVRAYREAHELRREMTNQELYLQGRYNYMAFSAVISRALSDKKHNQNLPTYPDYPIPITKREAEAEKQRKIKETYEWIEASRAAQKAQERNEDNKEGGEQ